MGVRTSASLRRRKAVAHSGRHTKGTSLPVSATRTGDKPPVVPHKSQELADTLQTIWNRPTLDVLNDVWNKWHLVDFSCSPYILSRSKIDVRLSRASPNIVPKEIISSRYTRQRHHSELK